jgi:hypothetical protein
LLNSPEANSSNSEFASAKQTSLANQTKHTASQGRVSVALACHSSLRHF